MPEPRVLQIIGDTDLGPTSAAAIELHGGLCELGYAVRTLALAPGRVGDLASTVPAIAHGRRTLAARTQLDAERRWADIVVFHGLRTLVAAARSSTSGSVPVVTGLWEAGPARTRISSRSSAGLILRRCARVVVSSTAMAATIGASTDGAVSAVVVPATLLAGARPQVDAAGWSAVLGTVLHEHRLG